MSRPVMTARLYGGEASHTFCRSNAHTDPDLPVRMYCSPWFLIKVSALAFVLVLDAIVVFLL